MITAEYLATELDIDLGTLTALAWDIACQDDDLRADYERLLAAPPGADIQISAALVARIKESLADSSDAVAISLLAAIDAARDAAAAAAYAAYLDADDADARAEYLAAADAFNRD